MNKRLYVLLCLAIVLTLWMGCKKEEVEKPIPFFDVNLVITPNPADGIGNLSFQTEPYLTFSRKVDFEYSNFSPSYTYKIVVDSSWICNTENQLIQTTKQYSINKDTLKFKPVEGFIANTGYKIKLQYHVEVKKPNSELYEVLLQDNQPFHGSFESSFNTKGYNFSVDTSNVDYAYPWPYQYHFLRKETTRGVLKLKLNQEYDLYFKNASFKVRFTSLAGQSWESSVTYNTAERKYTFQIPSDNLENQKIYKIEYIMVNGTGETVFLTYHFRTSMFNTFEEKINSIYEVLFVKLDYNPYISFPIKKFKIQEGFDLAEGKAFDGLIRFEANRDTSNYWISNYFFALYDRYNKSSIAKDFRSIEPVHIPPTNAIILDNSYLSTLLTQEQVNSGVAIDNGSIFQRVLFKLCLYYNLDYNEIRQRANGVIQPNQWDLEIQRSSFSSLYINTNYRFYIYYFAGDTITHRENWEIQFY